ncbi:NUDIX hydrolase [Candidatus Microthrix sp.]|uniref:NUDIX hydrolase n=1 Tax=Candidatus Neomicrothrix sp. TaxID=2719034 RepID=UPI001B5A946D|nr:NUDIX domain-containing protein [Candidatus Microthrix sp.]MBP6134249.1 NUDIX domain-containing protein [Candidatus Microthrix sp.]MBP6148915.1 NUDIX domain-containing protein [Candidatus Microthrix sp.]MBP7876995.1 NUDIX domain-containing protein [Candidatus Microthrix sp.]MBP8955966.1 NUDIX domain-containing protein [Candidatus Microthrix sp.]MBP9620486.1 NUDIX domain-containing protein [Candidatus Microthrix sp.]
MRTPTAATVDAGPVDLATMRPTLRRQAARVVAIDERGRVLLIKAHDPARPDAGSWWELPGGGIERGESSEHACLRELHEEGGVASALMGPVIWTQHVTFDFAGWHFDQDEVIHLAEVPAGGETLGEQRLEAFEAMAFEDRRWWSCDELLAEQVATLPPRLGELLGPVVAGDVPDHPVDIG